MSEMRTAPYLYKYRSLATAEQRGFVERTLLHAEIYFARPRDFNDPFDCAPVPKRLTEQKIEKYMKYLWKTRSSAPRAQRRSEVKAATAGLRRAFDKHQRLTIEETVNSCGVLSLSTKPDDVLMWSHYGMSHTGICLRFRVAEKPPFFAYALPVLYQDERPIVDITDLEARRANTLVDQVLLTKAAYWSYEDEFRLIDHHGGGVRQFPSELLEAVILGARISDENRELVWKWIKQRTSPVQVFQARFHEEKFAILIGPQAIGRS